MPVQTTWVWLITMEAAAQGTLEGGWRAASSRNTSVSLQSRSTPTHWRIHEGASGTPRPGPNYFISKQFSETNFGSTTAASIDVVFKDAKSGIEGIVMR